MATRRRWLDERDREILRLAIPALGALTAEPLYVLVDTAVVGHLGREALGGLALASAVLLSANALLIFLAYGTTAAVARLTGAGEHREAAEQAVQSLWLAAGIGVVLAVVGWPATPALIALLGGSGEIAAQGERYLRISLLGLPAMLLMLSGVGYLRGLRDTTRPLAVALATAAMNLVIELVLIYGFDRGIGASALATVIAQWTGALVYLRWIGRATARHRVPRRPDRARIRALFRVGVALMARTTALRGSFVLATAVAARIGPVALAAHTIVFELWSFLAFAHDAVAIAAQALVGYALGAGDGAEARAVASRSVRFGLGSGTVLGLALLAGAAALPSLFTDDPEVLEVARFLMVPAAALQPLGAVVFALDGVLIGAGDLRYLAGAMVAAGLVFVAAATTVLALDLGVRWLWAALAVFMAARFVGLWVRYRGTGWLVTGAQPGRLTR